MENQAHGLTEVRAAQTEALLPCPFCGGEGIPRKGLRDGYDNYQDDPDAWAHYIICRSCAGQGGWAKSASGARRWWNMRVPLPEDSKPSEQAGEQ